MIGKGRGFQKAAKEVDSGLCPAATGKSVFLGKSMRNQPGFVGKMIERQDDIVQSYSKGRYAEGVIPRGGQRLQMSGEVISEKTGSAPLKRGKAFNGRCGESSQSRAKRAKRIGMFCGKQEVVKWVGGEE